MDTVQRLLELQSFVVAVSVELQQEGETAEQRAHQQHTAIAILHVSSMDDDAQQ